MLHPLIIIILIFSAIGFTRGLQSHDLIPIDVYYGESHPFSAPRRVIITNNTQQQRRRLLECEDGYIACSSSLNCAGCCPDTCKSCSCTQCLNCNVRESSPLYYYIFIFIFPAMTIMPFCFYKNTVCVILPLGLVGRLLGHIFCRSGERNTGLNPLGARNIKTCRLIEPRAILVRLGEIPPSEAFYSGSGRSPRCGFSPRFGVGDDGGGGNVEVENVSVSAPALSADSSSSMTHSSVSETLYPSTQMSHVVVAFVIGNGPPLGLELIPAYQRQLGALISRVTTTQEHDEQSAVDLCVGDRLYDIGGGTMVLDMPYTQITALLKDNNSRPLQISVLRPNTNNSDEPLIPPLVARHLSPISIYPNPSQYHTITVTIIESSSLGLIFAPAFPFEKLGALVVQVTQPHLQICVGDRLNYIETMSVLSMPFTHIETLITSSCTHHRPFTLSFIRYNQYRNREGQGAQSTAG